MDNQKYYHASQLRSEISDMENLLLVFDTYKKQAKNRNILSANSLFDMIRRRSQVNTFNQNVSVSVVFNNKCFLGRSIVKVKEIRIPGSAIDKLERIMKLHLNHLKAQYEKL